MNTRGGQATPELLRPHQSGGLEVKVRMRAHPSQNGKWSVQACSNLPRMGYDIFPTAGSCHEHEIRGFSGSWYFSKEHHGSRQRMPWIAQKRFFVPREYTKLKQKHTHHHNKIYGRICLQRLRKECHNIEHNLICPHVDCKVARSLKRWKPYAVWKLKKRRRKSKTQQQKGHLKKITN